MARPHRYCLFWSQCCGWNSPTGSYYKCKMDFNINHQGTMRGSLLLTSTRRYPTQPRPYSEIKGRERGKFVDLGLCFYWGTRVGCLGFSWFHSLLVNLKPKGENSEKAKAPHSNTLAWKIPWTEEPGRLESMGLLRVGHDWTTSLSLFPFMHWRRKWQPTTVFLPGEFQGPGSLVGCRLWSHTELDTTEAT